MTELFGQTGSHIPSLDGATEWLDSEPLTPAGLRGNVVLVNFWTLTCINWLRQEPYVRTWSQAYRGDGLVVIGTHTPEFSFEHEIDLVRRATKERGIDYPVAVDNDYEIWSAFANHYWPALYFVDADGIIRDQHFGEGRYEQSERVIQRLLGVERELVSVEGVGVEAEADWDHLGTPETYLGSGRSEGSDDWALDGEWAIGPEAVVLDQAGGSIAFRFHARDANLVLSPERASRFPSASSSTARLRASHTAWTWTRTGTACLRTAPLPARARARQGPRTDPGDHVPRARCRGVRVHVRVGARAVDGHRTQRRDPQTADGRHFAVLATINPDGGPQTSAMWVARDGDDVLFSTVAGRRKHRNLQRDPRASVTVIDSEDPYNYVELRGRVTAMDEDVGRVFDTGLSWKYDGRDPDPDRPGAVRLTLRMSVDKATGYAA